MVAMRMRLSGVEEILVVDDSPDDLRLLSQLLQAENYQVRPVLSASEAFAALENQLADLILLDVRMPGMDGFELCRQLKANERTADIPVIYMSAVNETEDVVRGLQLGAVDYLVKPLKPAEVLARIAVHLGICRVYSELEQRNQSLRQINQQLESIIDNFDEKSGPPKSSRVSKKSPKRGAEGTVKLTARELDCLSLLAEGYRTVQIADQLNIKPVTVEFHLANVRNKLEAKTREQALVTAIMQGLMEPAFH